MTPKGKGHATLALQMLPPHVCSESQAPKRSQESGCHFLDAFDSTRDIQKLKETTKCKCSICECSDCNRFCRRDCKIAWIIPPVSHETWHQRTSLWTSFFRRNDGVKLRLLLSQEVAETKQDVFQKALISQQPSCKDKRGDLNMY